jgi:hypothetical protein
MAEIKLACGGINIGEWYVPPFELRGGAAVTIVIPQEFAGQAEGLAKRLTEEASDETRPVVRVRSAEAPQGFLWWLHGSAASRWLQRAGGISAASAKDILSRLNIRPDNLRSLPATPRLQLALEGAWASGAGAIIFDARGLDPLGRRSIFEMVEHNLAKCSAVFLSFPYHTQGEVRRDLFPNSAVIEMSRCTVAV